MGAARRARSRSGDQGPIADAGVPAVLVSLTGERRRPPGDAVSAGRLQGVGRGVLRALNALDAAPLPGAAGRGATS